MSTRLQSYDFYFIRHYSVKKQLAITERGLRNKDYSPRTMDGYLYGLKKYFDFKHANLDQFDEENVKDFLLDCEKNV